ncbi:MAG: hypothetical protein NC218_05725 [Acetobacter sp.]|nr:hypothetical protein [Acetobacter sp.]
MLNNLIYKLSLYKTLHRIFAFMMVLLLSGCGDGAGGEDENYTTQAKCWQTKIIAAVLKIINKLYERSSEYVTTDAMSTGGAAVICIAFAIWMAFKMLKTLSSLKEENLGEVWTEIGQKLFVCAFCMYIVYNPENINWAIRTFLLPIYNTILELGLHLLNFVPMTTEQSLGEYGAVTYEQSKSICVISNVSSEGPLDIKDSITPMANCLICTISDRLNSGIRIGLKLVGAGALSIPPKISYILVGILLMFLFTIAKFCFVLFVIDSLFRINFAIFLLPICIIGIPFNYTRKWSKHCFLMFLNSSGIMMFMGLLVVTAVMTLEKIIGTIGPTFMEATIVGLGPRVLSILFIAFILINIPGMAVALADKFIGGGGGDAFQKKITKFVMETAKRIGAAALGSVTSKASNIITSTLEKYEKTREGLDTARRISDKVSSKANSLAGYNND